MSVRSNGFLRRTAMWWLLLLAAAAAGGCGTLTSTDRVTADASVPWAVLTIENLSSTPMAGRSAASLVETGLRTRGVSRVASYRSPDETTLVALLDDRARRDEGESWARQGDYRYMLSGTVHEWRYKRAPEREPVVGLTLTLADVETGEVLWQGSASRSGWGSAGLSSVADRVVRDLLGELRLQRGPRAAGGR